MKGKLKWNTKAKWKDFLNPRSMLTPGVAGSVVMVIANTLWIEFTIPQKWSALVLSFMLIVPILVQFAASIFENIIYFVFNGLIVFALAVNTNFAGSKLQELAQSKNIKLVMQYNEEITSGFSSANHGTRDKYNNMNMLQLAADDTQNNQDNNNSSDQNDKDKKPKTKKNDKENRQFFEKSWF